MKKFSWAVIGAGPAGIAAVGKLLDNGIRSDEIAWIDPEFKVGDIGTKWLNVPSNTKVDLFLKFLRDIKSFNYKHCEIDFVINYLDPHSTCALSYIADPLQWVTKQLANKVQILYGFVDAIDDYHQAWQIKFANQEILANRVIMAVGSEPKSLVYAHQQIPLTIAIDHTQLPEHVTPKDIVGVFGSSHSAVLVMKNLMGCHVQHVINFYQSPLRYAIYMDNWILHDDTGLKGIAAAWARENIDGESPKNLERHVVNSQSIATHLPRCNKVVYAVGFNRRKHIKINHTDDYHYDDSSGIIAPGLFGCGIAFPEKKLNPLGTPEYRVGLWKFIDYLNRVLPIWMNYKL